MDKTMILKPRVSEKAYAQSQAQNVYVFTVPKDASKPEIVRAVQTQFAVGVEGIQTTIIKGKAKRTVRKGGRAIAGRESDFKKAYVTLKRGDSIPLFAGSEEAVETPAETPAKKPAKAKKEKK